MADSFKEATLAYKYSSPNLSFLEQVVLNKFWDTFVNVYPRWLAPNLISCTGGLCVLTMYALSAYFSPANNGSAQPSWLYALYALLLLSYQTLDGTDGKQARRTGSGSALGELMDHGIDAVATGFAAMVVCDAVSVDLDSLTPWLCVFGGQMAFFVSNLTLLHRGKQTFFPIDIMELQWVMILVLLFTGVSGTKSWITNTLPLPFPEHTGPIAAYIGQEIFGFGPTPLGTIQWRFVIAFGAVSGTISNFILYTYMASAPYRTNDPPPHVKRGVPGTGSLELARQILIIVLYGGLAFCSRYVISQRFQKENPVFRHHALRALLTCSCFAFGDLMDRVLVMRVAHKPIPVIPPTLICMHVFLMAALLLPTNGMIHPAVPVQFKWWWLCATVAFVAHMSFFVWVSNKLASALNIRIFRIPNKEEPKKIN